MKLHHGGRYYPSSKYIAGDILGEGVTADDVVAAISENGFLFSSTAAQPVPQTVGRAPFETAVSEMMGPYALGATQSLSFRPYDDMGFGPGQASDQDPFFWFSIDFLVENTGVNTPNAYPPYLKVTATPTGCHDGMSVETFIFTVSQADDTTTGTADPHKHFSISLCGGTDGCTTGQYFGYDIKVETLVAWADEADFKWSMMPNGILAVK